MVTSSQLACNRLAFNANQTTIHFRRPPSLKYRQQEDSGRKQVSAVFLNGVDNVVKQDLEPKSILHAYAFFQAD